MTVGAGVDNVGGVGNECADQSVDVGGVHLVYPSVALSGGGVRSRVGCAGDGVFGEERCVAVVFPGCVREVVAEYGVF